MFATTRICVIFETMDFFAKTIVEEFNLKMDKLIVYDCPCYNEYKYHDNEPVHSEDVIRLLLKYNKSYAACMQLKCTNNQVIVKHKVLPIMIGSKIDMMIRPNVDFKHQLGAFVLNGGIKILPSFITNNLRSGHVYRPSNEYKWYLNEDGTSADKSNSTTVHMIQYPPNEPTAAAPPPTSRTKAGSSSSCEDSVDAPPPPPPSSPRVRFVSTKRVTEKRVGVRGYSIKDESTTNHTSDDAVIELINRLSPVNALTDNAHSVTLDEYIEFFECSIKNYPELDDLCNKTIITATSIFETAIRKWSTLPQNSSKLGTLVSGNLFYALSSKAVSYIKNDEYKTAYLAVEGHRVSMIDKLISTVKRHISHGVKNSDALKLPRDASNFICPLNVKEMKNAGETMALAQFVMIAPYVALDRVVGFLNEATRSNDARDGGGGEPLLRVVIEGWLTNYRITMSDLIDMKRKMILVTMVYEDKYLVVYHAGHLPVKYSPKYKMFVGVYEAMNMFKDAFEGYTTFAAYTTFAMNFHRALLHMPPAKATVSINNIKGSCSTLTSRSDLHAFIHSIGFTNSAVMTTNIGITTDADPVDAGGDCGGNDEEFECVSFNDPSKFMLAIKRNCTDFTKHAQFPRRKQEPMPDRVVKFFKRYDKQKRANLSLTDGRADLLNPSMIGAKTFEDQGQCYRDLFIDRPEEHFKCIVDYLHDINKHEYAVLPVIDEANVASSSSSVGGNGGKGKRAGVNGGVKKSNRTVSTPSPPPPPPPPHQSTEKEVRRPFSDDEYETKMRMDLDSHSNTNRMLLYTGLCNLNCDSVEDGIIIDEEFHRNSPLKLFSVTLLLRVYAYTNDSTTFSHKAVALKPTGVYEYKAINKKFDGVIVFGVLITDQKVKIQRRRSINIYNSFIKNTYRYLITMNDPVRKPKMIDSFFQLNNYQKSSISIHYHYTERLGVGTKLANLHGQKGIVSAVKDLSMYKFWTASGKMVHPQVLFSKQSLVGRTTSSQTISMMNSPDLAVNGQGQIIAPLAFFVHQIEATAKCKQMFPKTDLMTAENGFVANGLIVTMNVMSGQYPLNESITENTFVLDLIKLGHVHVNLTPDTDKYNRTMDAVEMQRRRRRAAIANGAAASSSSSTKRRVKRCASESSLLMPPPAPPKRLKRNGVVKTEPRTVRGGERNDGDLSVDEDSSTTASTARLFGAPASAALSSVFSTSMSSCLSSSSSSMLSVTETEIAAAATATAGYAESEYESVLQFTDDEFEDGHEHDDVDGDDDDDDAATAAVEDCDNEVDDDEDDYDDVDHELKVEAGDDVDSNGSEGLDDIEDDDDDDASDCNMEDDE